MYDRRMTAIYRVPRNYNYNYNYNYIHNHLKLSDAAFRKKHLITTRYVKKEKVR